MNTRSTPNRWRRLYAGARLTLALPFFLTAISASAQKGDGLSTGLILLRHPTARALALSGALTADTNDVADQAYNPASLATLTNTHASIMYEKGLVDDSFSGVAIGSPLKFGHAGLIATYYDGGNFDYFDGIHHRNVTAKRDLSVAAGYAREWRGLAIGGAAKFLTSEILDQEHANAFAADLGVYRPVASNVGVGAALQNFGTGLKYGTENNRLPRLARVGVSHHPDVWSGAMRYGVDLIYSVNEQRIDGAVGAEAGVGPLIFRAGYRTGIDLGGLTLGAGFQFRNATFDYAFGLIDKLDSQHRVSLSFRFGAAKEAAFAKNTAPATAAAPTASAPTETASLAKTDPAPDNGAYRSTVDDQGRFHARHEVYVVQQGDTIASITKKMYGDTRFWRKIVQENNHVLADSDNLQPGQRLWIP